MIQQGSAFGEHFDLKVMRPLPHRMYSLAHFTWSPKVYLILELHDFCCLGLAEDSYPKSTGQSSSPLDWARN